MLLMPRMPLPYVCHPTHLHAELPLALVPAATRATLAEDVERAQACLLRSADLLKAGQTVLGEADTRLSRMVRSAPFRDR
jgi:hypothetical protein